MRHRSVYFRSSPQSTPDALNGRLFLSRSPPRPLERSSTGRFEACSCKPTSGGRLPSLVQHHELTLVFVTHDKFSPCTRAGESILRSRAGGGWRCRLSGCKSLYAARSYFCGKFARARQNSQRRHGHSIRASHSLSSEQGASCSLGDGRLIASPSARCKAKLYVDSVNPGHLHLDQNRKSLNAT
jgi:hypothetical protein